MTIAKIAEEAGIQCITIHGRTRQCKFVGDVEYDTIAAVKQSVSIPVVANGDIGDALHAKSVLDYTNADAVMIGRAAQGQPWLFQQVSDYLLHHKNTSIPSLVERANIIVDYIASIHLFYGDDLGVRLARKHIKWYLVHWDIEISNELRQQINCTEEPDVQLALVEQFLFNTAAELAA